MSVKIEECSTRLLLGNIGDSKMFLFKLKDSDEYLISIQEIDSPDIGIIGTKKEQYDIISEDGTLLEKYTIIGSITEKQLGNLGRLLSERFPMKVGNSKN
jgi:hypothetical protein